MARRPDRPDPGAREELVRRVRGWASLRAFGLSRDAVEDVVQDTCAEVWRTFNLARGGAAFEGFVQGRFVETLRANLTPRPPLRRGEGEQAGRAGDLNRAEHLWNLEIDLLLPLSAPERGPGGEVTRLAAALDELRARNPRHHRALVLLYEAQATPEEAADELAVDPWTLRSVIVRARLALAQSLERPGRGAERAGEKQRPGDKRRPAARGSGRPAAGKPRRQGRR